MNKWVLAVLATGCLLVTGCPHNQYVVELTPRGNVMERKLVFYREDGTDTNGVPNYQGFPTDELLAIEEGYPKGSLTKEGERRTIAGKFASELPADVGGAGSFTNIATTLGSAGFYMERFRGRDDIRARQVEREKAMDEFVDLVLGWSRQEFGDVKNYRELRRFIDGDFRNDFKNLGLYAWQVQTAVATGKSSPEEFAVRFGQYLMERGYLRVIDLPVMYAASGNLKLEKLVPLMNRLIAGKLKITPARSLPPALARMASPNYFADSWKRYLQTTDQYGVMVRHWQKEMVEHGIGIAQARVTDFLRSGGNTNKSATASAKPDKPDPMDVMSEVGVRITEFTLFGETDDHLVVKLALPAAPARTNGKWDEKLQQVLWESDIAARTNTVQLPVFCYADWSEPSREFQEKHFGKVALAGEVLVQYCLWKAGIDRPHGEAWEAFLTTLEPGAKLKVSLETFRFADEPPATGANPPPNSLSDDPRKWILEGLGEKPAK